MQSGNGWSIKPFQLSADWFHEPSCRFGLILSLHLNQP